MADIFNVEPPRWLEAIAKPIDTKLTGQVLATALGGVLGASERQRELVPSNKPGQPDQPRGGSWFSNFLGAAAEAKMSMADPFWRIKADQLKLKLTGEVLGLVQQQQSIDLHRDQMRRIAHDTGLTGWFSKTPLERMQEGSMPDFQSTEMLTRATAQQNADIHWMNQRAITDSVAEYNRRLDKLGVYSPNGKIAAAALRSAPMPSTGPTPQMLIALGEAETAEANARKADAAAAVAAAKAAGSTVPRVKVGPAGQVTTTWVPPTEKSSVWSDPDMPPPVETLSSGEVVEPIWNGRHWQLFRSLPGEKPTKMTPAQIAKRVEDLRFDTMVQAGRDPALSARLKARADELESYLTEVENTQMEKFRSAKPGGTAAPAGTNAPPATATGRRVRVIGPNGETGTVVEGRPLPEGWRLQP